MTRKEERYILLGIIVAILGTVAAWLAVPQVQSLLAASTATHQVPTLDSEAPSLAGVIRTTETPSLTSTPQPSVTFTPVPTNTDLPTATFTLEPTITPILPTATRSLVSVDRSSIAWDFNAGYKGTYEIPPGDSQPIRVTGAGYSFPNFPRLTYAVSGDFIVVVRIKLDSSQQIGNALRMAGLGIVSTQTNLIVLLGRTIAPIPEGRDVRGVGGTLDKMDDYFLGRTTKCIAKEKTTLKIVRQGPLVSFFCSNDGQSWIVVKDSFKIDLGDFAKVFLFSYSTDQEEIDGIFDKFEVSP